MFQPAGDDAIRVKRNINRKLEGKSPQAIIELISRSGEVLFLPAPKVLQMLVEGKYQKFGGLSIMHLSPVDVSLVLMDPEYSRVNMSIFGD